MTGGYRQMPPQVDLPALEHDVLARWRDRDIFARSLAQTADRPLWTFYEGRRPRTAGPAPTTSRRGSSRTCSPATRRCEGHHVPRRAGWDCHGLPVELAIEKRLGFSGKQDIEAYGIAEFNAQCRESVLEHVDEFARLTERMGYWVDLDEAYWTMDPRYIESVWWSLKQIFDKGLLVAGLPGHAVLPAMRHRRCPTTRSPRATATSPTRRSTCGSRSPAGRWPSAGPRCWCGPRRRGRLSATPPSRSIPTSPTSSRDRPARRSCSSSPSRWSRPPSARAPRSSTGSPARRLEHVTYARPFDLVDIPGAHFVVLADYVTIEDGTGLVHQAPAFGADDLAVAGATACRWSTRSTPDGHFEPDLPLVGGMFFKAADADDRGRPAKPAGCCFRAEDLRALLPALLALRHRAALLRAAVLVHPHDRDQGRAARARTSAPTGIPATIKTRPVRRLAGEQHRLGAVAQPLLGHAVADLALRARTT